MTAEQHLEAFRIQQRAGYRAMLAANPELAADIRQAVAYDAALLRQARLNGMPLPAHRRA